MRWMLLRLMLIPVAVLDSGLDRAGADTAPGGVRRHEDGRYSLVAKEATLAHLAGALARAADCRCRVDRELREQLLTLDLGPRSLERLVFALTRSAGARLVVSYQLEPGPGGRSSSPGRAAFARELVQVEGPMPKPVRAAVAELGVPVKVAEGVQGKVNLRSHPRPLGEALDAITRQTHSRWALVLSFEARGPSVDRDAEEAERMHEHLSELAQLSTEDRRAEMAERIHHLERLPEAERGAAVLRLADDISSLGTLLQRVPGEHRFVVGTQVLPVARDYGHVLSGWRSRRQSSFQPLFAALRRLDAALQALQ